MVDTSTFWTPPPPPPPRRRRRYGLAVGAGVLAGAAAGAVIATAVGADATTSGTGQVAAPYTAASGAATDAPDGGRHGGPGLDQTGTVTAVTGTSVTIKTSSGTTTYGVDSSSDIDKNGEAQLSDLAVGDAVRFSTRTVNGATVIGILHAGDETKDRPTGAPTGAPTGRPTVGG